jgi:hypothetical protein
MDFSPASLLDQVASKDWRHRRESRVSTLNIYIPDIEVERLIREIAKAKTRVPRPSVLLLE